MLWFSFSKVESDVTLSKDKLWVSNILEKGKKSIYFRSKKIFLWMNIQSMWDQKKVT